MGATYQVWQIGLLNSVLKKCGISDPKLRKEICGDFTFHQGDFFDEGSFKAKDKWLAPVLCFAERDDNSGSIKKLHLPSKAFSYHEYAFGDIDYFLKDHNEKLDFEVSPSFERE